jgi:hypothetical protein
MVMRKIHRDKSHYTNWPVLDSTPRGVLTQPSPAFIFEVTMKQIDISTPKHLNTFTMIDDEDFEWLNKYKWNVGGRGYVGTSLPQKDGFRKRLLMHKLLLPVNPPYEVDHRNLNRLDNQRCNLRKCTRSQNRCNTGKIKIPTSSIFNGVSYDKNENTWGAFIKENGRLKRIGTYKNEVNAAIAYDKEATRIYGEFARLNFPLS